MNEQLISDLFAEATRRMTGSSSREFSEKFAELIVQECMRQVEEQYKPVLEDEVMMNEAHWKGYLHCGVDSVVAIREHFGVEE